jgi:hypothetical protein
METPMSPTNMENLRLKARELLYDHRVIVKRNGKTFSFTRPSVRFYYPKHQWFWDQCFHTIANAVLGEVSFAMEEIRSLLFAQRPNGFIPHVVFWDEKETKRAPWHLAYQEARGRFSFLPFTKKPETTDLIQPPVIAQAVAKIFEVSHDRAFLEEVVPKLNRYYDYLLRERDPDRDHLITIICRFDGGLDWSPAYDPAEGFATSPPSALRLFWRGRRTVLINKLRYNYNLPAILSRGPFHVEDVAVNAILALNLDVLANLNEALGDVERATAYREACDATRDALIAHCYDDRREAFFNLTGRDERRFPILTIHSLLPLIIPRLPSTIAAALVERHLTNPEEFALPYPVPSVAANEPSFRRPIRVGPFYRFTWRDGSWVNMNWFLVHGLRRQGFTHLADALASRTRALVAEKGFYEYFDPITGQGFGAPDLGWSTLVVDM